MGADRHADRQTDPFITEDESVISVALLPTMHFVVRVMQWVRCVRVCVCVWKIILQ